MPREGEGHISDNAVESKDPIIHGAGKEPSSDHVDRADKTAEMPEPEKVSVSPLSAGVYLVFRGESYGIFVDGVGRLARLT